MSDRISIDSIPVVNLLELFKGEMNKLDDLVDKLDTETKDIKKTWQGKASDYTLANIEKFKFVFDKIKKENEKYIRFVDSTVEKYKAIDASQQKFMETRKTAFDTSFYGGNQG